MLKTRGYAVEDVTPPVDGISLTEFKGRFCDGVSVVKGAMQFDAKSKIDDSLITVWFIESAKVGVKPIRDVAEFMKERNITRAVIVVEQQVSPFGRSAIGAMKQAGMNLEPFLEKELKFDITTHSMVPKHQLLSSEEKKNF